MTISESAGSAYAGTNMYDSATSWPFVEARRIVERLGGVVPQKGYVLFETGYGPSGLPHIGTFGEVVRTNMVRYALAELTGWETRLVVFSDDMDGLRKVPDNIPNAAMLTAHLGKPLSAVPDPFGECESYAAQNNGRLRAFLDQFEFDYTFLSSTECYRSGRFNAGIRRVLATYDAIMAVMLPTLGAQRQASYSPVFPICPRTGAVLSVRLDAVDAVAGTICYTDPQSGDTVTLGVDDGQVKLQWKPDWAMRWWVLGVDYEMAGKDLIESGRTIGQDSAYFGGQAAIGDLV